MKAGRLLCCKSKVLRVSTGFTSCCIAGFAIFGSSRLLRRGKTRGELAACAAVPAAGDAPR